MFRSLDQVEVFFNERKTFGIKPGLDRMYRLLALQNHPEKMFNVIHIAGTNGKGSTATFIKHALMENDYSVGFFTSPSLTGITDHIWVNDCPLDEDRFISLLNQLLPSINELDVEEMHPTEFEILTTIAFMYFAEKVDLAIIETGMGGRDDSTNCVHPILSIITNIAMDHASFLGDTLEEITYHKAGIIKKNVPLIVGGVASNCLPVIYHEAAIKNATIYQLNKDFFYDVTNIAMERQAFLWSYDGIEHEVEIQMLGVHQIENASTALMALKVLEKQGLKIEQANVQLGLRNAQLAGRFEKVCRNPAIYIDGAHNLEGMKAILNTVEALFKGDKKHLVFAGFRDKELGKMIEVALPYFDSITICSFDHPRAEEAEQIIANLTSDKIEMKDWQEKVSEIKSKDEKYFFAGSLHFIGLVRAYIKNKKM